MAGINFDLIARALKQLQKTPHIIEKKEEDQHEPEGGERLIQETLKVWTNKGLIFDKRLWSLTSLIQIPRF